MKTTPLISDIQTIIPVTVRLHHFPFFLINNRRGINITSIITVHTYMLLLSLTKWK